MIMVESEGITEQVREWRTDVVAWIVEELGLENVMFEAPPPEPSASSRASTTSAPAACGASGRRGDGAAAI